LEEWEEVGAVAMVEEMEEEWEEVGTVTMLEEWEEVGAVAMVEEWEEEGAVAIMEEQEEVGAVFRIRLITIFCCWEMERPNNKLQWRAEKY
jgi:hypothetical protein